jgi:D-proline reductase (dithiol) PrdB
MNHAVQFVAEVKTDQERFERWVQGITKLHVDAHFTPNPQAAWTPLRKPLSECQVALVTSGGAHLASQQPFDLLNVHGDRSLREIAGGTSVANVRFSHDHYDHSDADEDPNCMLPLDRLRELVSAGELGGEAPRHFGFMGFIPNPRQLVADTAPAVARMLAVDGTDVVVLTPS